MAPACLSGQHVLEVDRRERRLARHEHELAPLLQRDGGGAVDQVRHRARRERAERAPSSTGRSRSASTRAEPLAYGELQSRSVVDRDRVARALGEAREHLVARQARVAVELGREHLDRPRPTRRCRPRTRPRRAPRAAGPHRARRKRRLSRGRRASHDLARRSPPASAPAALGGVEELPIAAQLLVAQRAARTPAVLRHHVVAELRRVGDVALEVRRRPCPSCAPISVRSGAPRFVEPAPGTCGSSGSPTPRRARRPRPRASLSAKPCSSAHSGRPASTSPPSDSSAVAPL